MENAWLAMQGEGGPLDDLIGHSIAYRIAVGPKAVQKLFTLQTVPARKPEPEQQGDHRGAADAGGFFAACGSGHSTGSAREVRTAVPLCEPPAACGGTSGAELIRPGSLHAQDPVPRRHHAHRAGTAGSDGEACRAGAAATDAPDPIPRGVRAAQQAGCSGDTGASGSRSRKSLRGFWRICRRRPRIRCKPSCHSERGRLTNRHG
jgi:hypothetical protein